MNVPLTSSFHDVTGVQIYDHRSTCTIFSVYVPNSVATIRRDCLNKLLSTDHRVIIGGDFNSRSQIWGCHSSNSRGTSLAKFYESCPGYVHLSFPDSPTYIPSDLNRHPSIIDGFILKRITQMAPPRTLQKLFSDHNPVILLIDLAFEPGRGSGRLDFSRANWSHFRDSLDAGLMFISNRFECDNDLDEGVCRLNRVIDEAVNSSVPPKRVSGVEIPPWIRRLIGVKNYVRHMSQKPEFSRDRFLKSFQNFLQSRVRTSIADYRNAMTKKKLENLRPHDNQMYVHLKKLTNVKDSIPPLKSPSGAFLYSSADKAACLAKHFHDVHVQNVGMGDPSHDAFVQETVHDFLSENLTTESLLVTSVEEVKNVVRGLKNGKSPGLDSVRSLVFKNLSLRGLQFYTSILNASFRLSYFPNAWKTAKIIPICKPGKPPDEPGSRRPVSLLPIPGKVCESIVCTRLENVIQEKNLLPDRQFGFRKRHSTTHALLNFTNEVRESFREGKTMVAVGLDIEKAFDTVWLQGLIFKLMKFGFPQEIVKYIQSYVTDRKFRVSINDVLSDETMISQGIPEGSVLGPILFDIYVSDIPTVPFTTLDMFADDTTVKANSLFPSVAIARVQSHLDILHQYFSRWKIKVNPTKTECMIFTKKRKLMPINSLYYNGSEIRKVEEMKILGVTVDKKLSFGLHVDKVVSKAKDVSRKLRPMLKHNSGLSQVNRVLIYKVFIRSVLTYCIPIWHAANSNNMRKIQTAQNKALRYVLNLRPHPVTYHQMRTSAVHELANVEFLSEFAQRLTLQFYARMIGHPNDLIDSLSTVRNGSLVSDHPFFIIREWLSSNS